MNTCDFCNDNVDKKQKIFESKFIKILYPKKPIIKHHFMLMPINHKEALDGLDNNEAIELVQTIRMIKQKMQTNKNYAGYNAIFNAGKKAGQEVKHAHLHIFTRYHDEEISPFDVLKNPQENRKFNPDSDAYAKCIKEFSDIFS